MLRDAAGHSDDRIPPRFLLEYAQFAEPGVELLLRVLANAARVDDDDVGLDILGRRLVAGLVEEPCHTFGVMNVHLAAERLDEIFPGHA